MRVARGRLAVAVVLVLAVAGCAKPPPVPEGIPVGSGGEALPTVQGTVVDSAIKPIAGVRVYFLGTDVNTTTAEDGTYAIYRPTALRENVMVTAWKQGFSAQTHMIAVSGHSSAVLHFRLEAAPYQEAYSTVLQFRGTLGCIVAVSGAGQQQRASCDAQLNPPEGPPANTGDFYLEPNFAGAVVQVVWEAESDMTRHLHAWIEGPAVGGQGGPLLVEATGPSQIRLEIDYTTAREKFGDWSGFRVVTQLPDAPPGGPVPGVGASVGQTFDVYATVFYKDPAPAGYVLS